MDWSHTEKRGWGNTKCQLTMELSGKQEEGNTKKIPEEDRLLKKRE
jgi:hypothetical protein